MTDPRDEALRACVEALQEAEDKLAASKWNRLSELGYSAAVVEAFLAKDRAAIKIRSALATARAALAAKDPTP